jgi:hypothetical protein
MEKRSRAETIKGWPKVREKEDKKERWKRERKSPTYMEKARIREIGKRNRTTQRQSHKKIHRVREKDN